MENVLLESSINHHPLKISIYPGSAGMLMEAGRDGNGNVPKRKIYCNISDLSLFELSRT